MKQHRIDLRFSSTELDNLQELLDLVRKTRPRDYYQEPWNRTNVIVAAITGELVRERLALAKIADEPLPLYERDQIDPKPYCQVCNRDVEFCECQGQPPFATVAELVGEQVERVLEKQKLLTGKAKRAAKSILVSAKPKKPAPKKRKLTLAEVKEAADLFTRAGKSASAKPSSKKKS